VREPIHVAGAEDEAPAELERILAQSVLAMARGSRPPASCRILTAKQVEKGSCAKVCGAICLPPLVNQEREVDARFFAEKACVVGVAEPNSRQVRASVSKCLRVLAQLRDVLAAEDSTVVSEEDDDRRAFAPQRPEAHLAAFAVGQDDPRKFFAERWHHGR
jgi:hypothetical protein